MGNGAQWENKKHWTGDLFDSALASAAVIIISGETIHSWLALLLGAVIGVAYAVGFCMIIFYCLKIGPAGPTVTGILLTILSLILIAGNKVPSENAAVSAKWFRWAILGRLFSGISMFS